MHVIMMCGLNVAGTVTCMHGRTKMTKMAKIMVASYKTTKANYA